MTTEKETSPASAAASVGASGAAAPSTKGEQDAAGGEGAPSTRRRRGSRGGRRRRKPAAAPESSTETAAQAALPAPEERAALPAGSASGDGVQLIEGEAGGSATNGSSRRRRGSRGGRRRRKPAAASGTEVAAEGSVEPVAVASDDSITAPGRPDAASDAPPAARPSRRTQAARRRRSAAASPEEGVASEASSSADAPLAEEAAPSRRSRRRRSRSASSSAPEPSTSSAEPSSGSVPPAPAVSGLEAPPEPSSVVGESGEDSSEPAKPKRSRRGLRGGRRSQRRRSESSEVAESSEPAEASTEKPPPAPSAPAVAPVASSSSSSSRPRSRDRRRPKAIVRQDEGSGFGVASAALPSPKSLGIVAEQTTERNLLVTDDGCELRVALVEDGRLAEIYIERPDRVSYLGDIYKGKVESVMGGIDAAFVDFGLDRNGFLYVNDIVLPDAERRPRRIVDAAKVGQEVLVQVTKDPMGSKGARLTTKISLAGRYLVYVPGGSGVGVSRRLPQGERDRLREISKKLRPRNAGLIIRTLAEGHDLEDLRRDMRYLSRLWSRLKKKAETVKAPGLVHKEVDISIEATRDLFNDTCESLVVDDPKRHKAIVAFLDKEAPELLPRVRAYDGAEPLFEAYKIEEQIARALERRVPLPSGGNLMIDHAEALTVIDVNTGRFTRGKGLEDTITKTNLEAAREVVRQLRLRDIGGIIIIDFIDMAHVKNREMVLATLEAELETDRTKTYVVELSPLGLVEMTRQNTTDGARGIMTRTCPSCLGKARVLSAETMALSVERRLRNLARRSQAKSWLIEINGDVVERLSGDRLKRLEKQTGRRIFFEGSSGLPIDSFRLLAEGAPAQVMAQRIPLREGQEVEVELEFALTYSPRDAVGYIDGYMLIVEGGRKYLGERRKVCVVDTARTGARATVVKQG